VADETSIHGDAQKLYDAMKRQGLVRALRTAVEQG